MASAFVWQTAVATLQSAGDEALRSIFQSFFEK